MKKSLSAAVLVFVVAVLSSSAFGEGPQLSGVMEARKIVLDEENREKAVAAEEVYPNDTIEYTLRYRNTGNASASNVCISTPVPEGTIYRDRSATDTEKLHPLFSIDGGTTYHEAPVTYTVVNEEGEEETRTATPDMITDIKWTIGKVLEIGQEVAVTYRVQVK